MDVLCCSGCYEYIRLAKYRVFCQSYICFFGTCLELVWNLFGTCLELVWNFHILIINKLNVFFGTSLELVWNLFGTCLELSEGFFIVLMEY